MRNKFRIVSLIVITMLIIANYSALVMTQHNHDDQLSEYQRLQGQIIQLQIQITQCRNDLQFMIVMHEQDKLVEEYRETLKAGKKDEFDWSTMKFKSNIPNGTVFLPVQSVIPDVK